MNTQELVEWQKYAPNGLVYPWWTHPFLDVLETWDLSKKRWLEFGGGRSTAWLRSKCEWVDTIESNIEWAEQAGKDCEINKLSNGVIYYDDIPDGIQDQVKKYISLIPKQEKYDQYMRLSAEYPKYDIISVDGIWRNECLQWAVEYFMYREGGIIIADNWQQDYVWISQSAKEFMSKYKMYQFYQLDHTNHEGRPWNTVYWEIPARTPIQ